MAKNRHKPTDEMQIVYSEGKKILPANKSEQAIRHKKALDEFEARQLEIERGQDDDID